MCGIIGYSIINSPKQNIFALESGIKALCHRGPDNSGIWTNKDGSLGMAHARLSILDLTENANQPMVDENKEFILGFNGEIYNFIEIRENLKMLGYKFTTNSDTEVILQGYKAWNKELFKKLRGMFAISIYDILKKEIILARDHSGQKPLFYYFNKNHNSFIFSSELKGMFNFELFSKSISYDSLSNLFNKGYCPGTSSIYENVKKLNAGSYLVFDLSENQIKTSSFWSLKNILKSKKNKYISEEKLIKNLEDILLESIEMQFRSDVPVGMLLSGGVDSSLIVALASKIKGNLDTYTVRFSEYKKFDESYHARLIADHFKTNHLELEASEVEPSIFEEIASFFDEPIFDTSIIPTYMLSKMISQYCKVAIGGDGGDELFGGYPHYDKLLRIERNSKYLPYYIRNKIFNFFDPFLPIGIKGAKTLEFYGTNFVDEYPNISEFFKHKEQLKLFNKNFASYLRPTQNKIFKSNIFDNIVERATYQDFKNYLREDILVKVDRASMANSLEIRSPFLDHKLIEFAFNGVPHYLKVDSVKRKILLKKLAKRHLPNNFDFDRKQGFSLPLRELINSKKWIEYICSKIKSSNSSIFNHQYAYDLLKKQKPYHNNAERLAALLFFMIWVEKFEPLFNSSN
tara:strand:- start:3002 stop:4894 length:1893 start_codon:yes stop_codon:yes gene_type:complete